MPLVDWQDAGLPNHSGAVRYRRRIDAPEADAAVRLELGEVRGTAEVLIDGESAGVRVCSPYAFDLSGRIGPDGATIEIVILNTLAPHLDGVGPTPYVFAGQRRSGLFGPVRVLASAGQSSSVRSPEEVPASRTRSGSGLSTRLNVERGSGPASPSTRSPAGLVLPNQREPPVR
jgi:hypothetical protein